MQRAIKQSTYMQLSSPPIIWSCFISLKASQRPRIQQGHNMAASIPASLSVSLRAVRYTRSSGKAQF